MNIPRIVLALLLTAAPVAAPQTPGNRPDPAGSGATVLFSRSAGDSSNSSPQSAAPANLRQTPAEATNISPAALASDAERRAVTIVAYDLDVHLQPRQQAMQVRARMVLRNDSDAPLLHLPLQISSQLSWTAIRVADAPAAFVQHEFASDADHTGKLDEAVISLAHPIAPHETVAVDAEYEGAVPATGARLEQIGVPAELANNSDWDRIGDGFTGLRGFGNVVWYPVSSLSAKLGQGDQLFSEIAEQRFRQSASTIKMQVTAEFFGPAPNLAVLDGKVSIVTPQTPPLGDSVPGIAIVRLPERTVGFEAPSLFLLRRSAETGNGVEVFARTEDLPNAQAYMTAASMVTPLIHWWMGSRPKSATSIVDLPENGDAPYEDGSVLFTSVQSAEPQTLAGPLLHLLANSYFHSPYPWLQEGAANFMATLWMEREQGRDAAIRQLNDAHAALSLAEPAAQSPGAGETLLAARDPIYYRTKATYIFWMLRDLAGDDALATAFRRYRPQEDGAGDGFERVLEQAAGKNLRWLFEDWVYHDRGLPELSIANVFSNAASIPGTFLVSVDVSNDGSAAAEVPVSVTSGSVTVTERVMTPARSKVSHRFLIQGEPLQVAVNDGTVPEVDAAIHRRTLTLRPSGDSAP